MTKVGPSEGGQTCAATIDFDCALTRLVAQAAALGWETVPLAKAGRRFLAEPVLARIDGPQQDTSAMDGFALRRVDVDAGQTEFHVVGASFPFRPCSQRVKKGEAVRITTGGAIPAGADWVVMIERVVVEGAKMLLASAPSARNHIRMRGSDFSAGSTIVPVGKMIDPRTLVAAAAADVASLKVWKRPSVAVLVTGDELAAPGSASVSAHLLPDSLSDALLMLCHQWGAKPDRSARVKDDPEAIERVAAEMLQSCDVLVMVGGASRGERDFAKSGLQPLGLELIFADVLMKPGKPVWYGRIGMRHVIGLPGNPTAAITVARLLLVPLLTVLGGRGADAGLRWIRAPLVADAPAGGDRESFLCAERSEEGVSIIARQDASGQAMLARSDLLVRRPRLAPPLSRGAMVDALRF